jgi:MoxR-like ATPase
MPNTVFSSEAFADTLARVITSSRDAGATRACLLTTRDRDHALSVLKSTVTAANRTLYHFTVAARRRYSPTDLRWATLGADTLEAVELLRVAGELRGGGVVAFEDVVPFLRDEGGDARVRMTLAEMLSIETRGDGLVLVFIEPPESERRLPSMLADQIVRLDVPYPRSQELEAIAREELGSVAHRAQSQLEPSAIRDAAPRLASGLVGLTRSAGRDALRDALAPSPTDFDRAYETLSARKASQLRRELAMNVLDTTDVEEPIGLDYLVEYLGVTRERIATAGPDRAKGILLIGPPGTGKTMLARAVGRLVQLPVVEFRISSLMNSLLGETERRFAQAFAALEAMSPNVVFIDELEKAFGDSSERDGGTMMRCTGALLTWLSDNPYANFIVATSNSLRRMGEIGLTMTRSERFDAAFFVDVPSLDSRRMMLERWLGSVVANADEIASVLAAETEKFSGADLRSVVKQATAAAGHARRPVTDKDLLSQVERKRMRAFGLYDEFQELRRWGRMYCDPAGPTD